MARRLALCMLMLALLVSGGAYAQELPERVQAAIPEGAVIEGSQEAGPLRMLALSIPETGEALTLTYDARAGEALFVQTDAEAWCSADAETMTRGQAEEIVFVAYPGCRVLFAEDTASGKRLAVVGDGFCGSIVAADGKIRSRSLQMGEIFSDGTLTMEGALQVLALHRPEAQLRALELDMDDGTFVYEGEALVSGEEYEFELDATTGRLLEWERD